MKPKFLALLLLVFSSIALAHGPHKEFQPVKLVVTINDDGPVSKEVTLKKRDGSIFFINSSTRSEVSVEVEMGNRTKHCWTPNMAIRENGNIGTVQPLKPNDFALLCFPEAGVYQVQVSSKEFNETVKVTVEGQQ